MTKALPLALAALGLGLAYLGYQVHRGNDRIDALEHRLRDREAVLDEILGEVTRHRIEESATTKGVSGLLEKLRTYAPLLSSASTTKPDYESAKKEMVSILRAFEALGADAWEPIMVRFDELDPRANFDECKWLLEAATAVDEKRGIDLARRILLGLEKPSPRLRWYAADLLTQHDRPLAQSTLRRILLTESSRGINLDRAQAYGATIPDQAAFATTGFHNFVVKYENTGDEQMDETLLMVMGRSEHDLATVQECVKILGRHRYRPAAEAIEKLYRNPPGFAQNPLFQNHCLDALHSILGDEARPFFEEQLRSATTDTVAKHLQHLLGNQ